MDGPKPSLSALLVCDQVIEDKATNKKSIIGAFTHIWAQSFPCSHQKMGVYFCVTDAEGSYDITLRLANADSDQVLAEGETGQTARRPGMTLLASRNPEMSALLLSHNQKKGVVIASFGGPRYYAPHPENTPRRPMRQTDSIACVTGLLIWGFVLTACVSLQAHNETAAQLDKARKVLTQAGEEIKTLQQDKSRLAKENEELKKRIADFDAATAQVKQDLAAARKDLETALEKQQAAERDRAARETQLKELTQTRDDLAKSLEAEIAKEDVKVSEMPNGFAVTMVEHLLFSSGQTQLKPEALKVLKQIGESLKNVPDKSIRIEGHTDSKGIGSKLRDKYPTNWELSTARAASVVRYLVEGAGLDRESLTAVGYADTRPVAANDTPQGRKANRRIEIMLYPKSVTVSASPGSPTK